MSEFFESSVQAEYVGKRLDFLTKELVRLREERRIAAMVRYAERTRRMREAEESGQRQAELVRRNQEDEIFGQVAQVHQDTVQSYLEDLILSSTLGTSDVQAREEVAEYAQKLNEIVCDPALDDSDLIADLVSSFLIPEVERETLREQSNCLM